jgi:hypothetical protein
VAAAVADSAGRADGPAVGTALLHSGDPAVRSAGCDLLGVAAGMHEGQREAAASALLALGESERDGDVRWSIARALGATADPRAVPLLARLADHPDPDVRFQVALSLPNRSRTSQRPRDRRRLLRLTCYERRSLQL